MLARKVTLEELLDAIRSPDDVVDIEVYRLLVQFLETLGDSDDISDKIVHNLILYRPKVIKMINIEVESIKMAELLRADGES